MSSMAKQAQQRVGILQGTLDMLILRTLLYGPAHGHQIGKHIQMTTNEFLQMQHGSLYPALHRLERDKLVAGEWRITEKGRRARYYKLMPAGRKRLAAAEQHWSTLAKGVARVLRFA